MVHTSIMEFEWDPKKEEKNLEKYGISFVAAARLLAASHYIQSSDRNNEVRYLAIGEIEQCVLAVVYTKRGDKHRIISARRASKNEKAKYQEHCKL